MLIIDTAIFESKLFASGQRGPMQDVSGKPREPGALLSLTNLLQGLGVDIQCTMHNSGNDAFMCLLAFQLLLDRDTKVPSTRGRSRPGVVQMQRPLNRSPSLFPQMGYLPTPPLMFPMGVSPQSSLGVPSPTTPDGYFDQAPARGHAVNGRSPGKRFNTMPSSMRRDSSDLVDEMGKMTVG